MLSAPATLMLPRLIGLTLHDAGCALNSDQMAQLGTLLLQIRPQDSQAICFVGGALSSLVAGNRKPGTQQVVSLQGDFGDDPFLIIAGPRGAMALLAGENRNGYQARILSDPDVVDRAALVLAQFGDHAYSLDAVCDPEAQRAFIATIVTGLLGDPVLRPVDLAALLPEDKRWVTLAQALSAHPNMTTCLALPAVRQFLQEGAVTRLILGQLDADQQHLTVIAAEGGAAPRTIPITPGTLASVLQSRRIGVAASLDASGLQGEAANWLRGAALTVVPLMRDGRVWGILLAASERPLSGAARANLNGLGTLLAAAPSAAPMPAPQALPTPPRPFPGAFPPSLSAAPSKPGPAAQAAPVRPGAGFPAAPPPPPAAPSRPATGFPAAPPPPAAPSRPAATNDLRQRAMNRALPAPRSSVAATQQIVTLIEQLGDAVLLVDVQGRLVSFTDKAVHWLGISREAMGKSLVESGAWYLAPLLTDALTGDLDGVRDVELPDGQQADVKVVAMDQGMWAFILHKAETPAPMPSAPAAPSRAPAPAVNEQERNESFLANFSNIIRVPLRELRNLITSVPAAGELNEQQSRLIGQVVKLNSELTMLVNDLLALGQIRLQTSENRVPLRLDLLVEAAVGTQYAEFGRRGQHVTTDIPPGLPRVPGSEEGLGRAVAALLDNAIKYSPTGAHIKVSVARDGSDIVVTIQDSGIGIAPDELEQVFDPFYRARSAEQLAVSGRGLGLTIAKAVIEQHGGYLWATSTPGVGSTFSFSLPGEG